MDISGNGTLIIAFSCWNLVIPSTSSFLASIAVGSDGSGVLVDDGSSPLASLLPATFVAELNPAAPLSIRASSVSCNKRDFSSR